MKGTWKLKVRMALTMIILFTIVYFLVILAGSYLDCWELVDHHFT